jgi:hypothetical protein
VLKRALALAGLAAALAVPQANARDLTNFRKPNALERGYVAVAIRLHDATLCQKVSPKALTAVDDDVKLLRSDCFARVAVATRSERWCEEVQPAPAQTEPRTVLDPERCRADVKRLDADAKDAAPAFDHETLLRALGYKDSDLAPFRSGASRTSWERLYEQVVVSRNRVPHRDFLGRLAQLPDFTTTDRPEDSALYFRKAGKFEEAARGSGMPRGGLALRLNDLVEKCSTQGKTDSCAPEVNALVLLKLGAGLVGLARDAAQRAAEAQKAHIAELKSEHATGVKPNEPWRKPRRLLLPASEKNPSQFRPATPLEKLYHDAALAFDDPDACAKISPDALTVGWIQRPGFYFTLLRSYCFAALAVATDNEQHCGFVRPVGREDLDGDGMTAAFCRETVAGKAAALTPQPLPYSREAALRALGYGEGDLPVAQRQDTMKVGWKSLADSLLGNGGAKRNDLRTRVRAGPDMSVTGETKVATAPITEGELARHQRDWEARQADHAKRVAAEEERERANRAAGGTAGPAKTNPRTQRN